MEAVDILFLGVLGVFLEERVIYRVSAKGGLIPSNTPSLKTLTYF